jgi:pilus assembly protein CpaC
MLRARNDGAPRPIRLLCATVFLLFVSVGPLYAQGQVTNAAAVALPGMTGAPAGEAGQVNLVVGRSTVLDVGVPIARVSLSRPEIADAVPTTAQQLLIHGKAPGAITMFVWDRSGGIRRFEVTVARDLTELATQMQQLFPGEPIKVSANGKDLVLAGTVSSKYIIEKATDVAAGYVEKKENVVNLLRQADSLQSNQVLLRVRFAEVSRSALTELGASLFTGALGFKNYTARTTTQQFPAPIFDSSTGDPKLIFSDFLNLFLFNNKEGLGTVIHALQTKGAFQSLAEPNLVAESGKEASFLAGGEYPYPAVQGNGASLAVTIVFKEFGIRLTFTPTILGPNTIHLKVRPEVSSLDFTNAINYQGFRIPSLSTRRAETEVELQDGQTFAIAGLMNNTMNSSLQKMPGIGDIPILGLLFRSKAAQKNQSELVVMITPQILPRNSTGTADRLPSQVEPYLGPPSKGVPPPPPYLGPQKQEPPSSNSTVPSAAQSRGATGVDERATTLSVMPRATSAPVPGAVPARIVSQPQPASPPVQGPAATSQSARPPQTATSVVTGSSGPPAPPTAQAVASEAPPTTIVTSTASPSVPKPDPKAAERARKAQQRRDEAAAQAQAKQQELEKLQQEADARALAQKQQEEAKVNAANERRAAEQAKKDAKAAAQRAKLEKAKQDEARKVQEKLAREQAKRDAGDAKHQAESERKQAQQLQDAEAQLKAAQAALEAAQLKKAKQ